MVSLRAQTSMQKVASSDNSPNSRVLLQLERRLLEQRTEQANRSSEQVPIQSLKMQWKRRPALSRIRKDRLMISRLRRALTALSRVRRLGYLISWGGKPARVTVVDANHCLRTRPLAFEIVGNYWLASSAARQRQESTLWFSKVMETSKFL